METKRVFTVGTFCDGGIYHEVSSQVVDLATAEHLLKSGYFATAKEAYAERNQKIQHTKQMMPR